MALAFARRAAWLLAARAALALVNIESRTPNSHFRTAARRGLHTGARRATLLGMAQIDFPKAGAPIGKFYAYVVSDMGRLGPRRKARGLRIHARRVKAAKRRAA